MTRNEKYSENDLTNKWWSSTRRSLMSNHKRRDRWNKFRKLQTEKGDKLVSRMRSGDIPWRKVGVKNKHHIIPQEVGGNSSLGNIATIDMAIHGAIHFLFNPETLRDHPEINDWIRQKRR